MVMGDLLWARRHCKLLVDLPGEDNFTLGPWSDYIRDHPGPWAKQVTGAGIAAAAHARRSRTASKQSGVIIDTISLFGVIRTDPARAGAGADPAEEGSAPAVWSGVAPGMPRREAP